MIDNIWFCEPNDARESWCFFTVKLKKHEANDAIASWEVCYTNPNRVIRMAGNDTPSEEELLRGLLREIYYCRKKEITLITFGENVIPLLRTRIVYHCIRDVNLRSLKVLSIQKILQDYFFFGKDNTVSSISDFAFEMKNPPDANTETETLYEIFKRIGPLLPSGVIE